MRILLLDLETDGLDPSTNKIIEIGAALYDWESRKPIALLSEFIAYEHELPQNITEITGIEPYMLEKPLAIPLKNAIFKLEKLCKHADYYAAHNAEFDFNFIHHAETQVDIKLPLKKVIDTRYDLPLPGKHSSFKLGHLLADHGLFNPFAHRALFDCMSTFMLMRIYPLEEILTLQASPLITIQALVSFDEKDLAKEKGFRWEPKTKKWLLDIKRSKWDSLKDEFPFKSQIEFEIPF